ncbi:MAG: hypothetical protein ABJB76_00285 [Candidatus Nitrosocosmicus sp.]
MEIREIKKYNKINIVLASIGITIGIIIFVVLSSPFIKEEWSKVSPTFLPISTCTKIHKLETPLIIMINTMNKKSNKNNDDLVLTPGGLRSENSVKQVGPNESIHRNEDGTYTVVPQEQIPNDKNV